MMTGMVSSGYFLTFPFRRKGSMNKLVLLSRHKAMPDRLQVLSFHLSCRLNFRRLMAVTESSDRRCEKALRNLRRYCRLYECRHRYFLRC